MVPFSCGSSFLSFSSTLNAQTWSSGPRRKTMSSKSFSLRRWQRCGARKRTSPPWTTKNWAVASATIMARVSSKRSMAKDMSTSSCAISPRSWATIPWWTSAKILWKSRSVENQWCRLKLKICLFRLQLKTVNLRDLLTLVFCSSFPFVVDNPNVFYFGDSFCSLYQALNRQLASLWIVSILPPTEILNSKLYNFLEKLYLVKLIFIGSYNLLVTIFILCILCMLIFSMSNLKKWK